MTKRTPAWLIVVFVFAGLIGLNLVVSFMLSFFPSPEEACSKHCLNVGRRGVLTYVYREELTRGMRGRGPKECQCK